MFSIKGLILFLLILIIVRCRHVCLQDLIYKQYGYDCSWWIMCKKNSLTATGFTGNTLVADNYNMISVEPTWISSIAAELYLQLSHEWAPVEPRPPPHIFLPMPSFHSMESKKVLVAVQIHNITHQCYGALVLSTLDIYTFPTLTSLTILYQG